MGKIDELMEKMCPKGVKFYFLGDIATFSQGIQVPVDKQHYQKEAGDIRFLRIIDYTENEEPPRYIKKPDDKYIKKINDLIMIRYGTPGKVCLDYEGAVANNMFKITFNKNDINIKFMYYYLSQSYIYNNLSTSVKSTMPSINFGIVSKIKVPVPPLEVQNEIVCILDIFTELSTKLSAELKARKKQYEYYRNKLLNIKNGIPMTIGDIYDFKYGTGNTIPEESGNYPVYGSNGQVGYYKEYNSEDAPVIGHIGAYAGIVNWASGKHFVTYNGVICKHKNNNVDKRYAYFLLLEQNFIGEQKGAQPFVSYDALKKPIVTIPTLEKQKEIVTILEKFEKLCHDTSEGLPAEIKARQKQYEHYRDKLLNFKELKIS